MRTMTTLLCACLVMSNALSVAESAEHHVDLSALANTALEDDGVSNNQQGGWSDEGINDMFVYPPIPEGAFSRNGHSFTMTPDRSVIMLKGLQRGTDKPESAYCPIDKQKAPYIYVLHNSVGGAGAQENNFLAARYTLQYEDGSTHSFDIRNKIEIQHWWCGQWWHNAEAASWPVFMGRNYYSMKWRQFIGVWSCQLINPQPDKNITGITLRSMGLTTPVIFAITLSDIDRSNEEQNPDKKKHFAAPPGPSADYFTHKIEQERRGIFSIAVQEGRLKGLREVYAIRNNLLAVHVDNGFAGIATGNGNGMIEALQQPDTFVLKYADGKDITINTVGRQSYESWVGDIGPYPANTLFTHVFYLHLKEPLMEGKSIHLRMKHIDAELESERIITYSSATNPSPAIKVNQVSYAAQAHQRYAYLGWWAGDTGTVDFSDCRAYQIIDPVTNTVIVNGTTAVRGAADSSGEEVYDIDLSDLPPGKDYRILIPNVGISPVFSIGSNGSRTLYQETCRAFFHQRAGCELTSEHTDFPRKASHLKVYRSGYMVDNASYRPAPDEDIKEFRGGYHDAGDDDVFTFHLRATYQMLSIYALHSESFGDGDLNIPESGNGIPDVLDEARWALFFFADNMTADGIVPLGRGHDQDHIRAYEREHGQRPPYGILPGRPSSNGEFAAVAAQFARLIQPFDTEMALKYQHAASKAYHWLSRQPVDDQDRPDRLFRVWAAIELYHLTRQQTYHDDVKRMLAEGYATKTHWSISYYQPLIAWSYLSLPNEFQDQTIISSLKMTFFNHVDGTMRKTAENIYRWGWPGKTLGWGNGNGGGYYGYYLVLAHHLSGKQQYLDAASLQADFQLGCNPLSRTFITGLGTRPPINPQVSPLLYAEPKKSGRTVKGISIYGLAGNSPISDIPSWHPTQLPVLRSYRDIGGGSEVSSEFTITETIGVAAGLYGYLYAIQN